MDLNTEVAQLRPTRQEQAALKQADILDDASLRTWPSCLTQLVTLEQAVLFLGALYPGWVDDQGRPDTKQVHREVRSGRLGKAGFLGLGYQITIEDLLRYDPDRQTKRRAGPLLLQWVIDHKVAALIAGGFWVLVAILGIFSQIYQEPMRYFFTPPKTTTTIVIEASRYMVAGDASQDTMWQAALRYTQQKLREIPFPEQERVAVWIQRAKPGGVPGICDAEYDLVTKRYIKSERLDLDKLLSDVELSDESEPGLALLAAAREIPRVSLAPVTHHAFVITSGQRTCRGASPVDDICEQLVSISERWSTRSNSNLKHKIALINLDAGRVYAWEFECPAKPANIEAVGIDVDPNDPAGSNDLLCERDPSVCGARIFPIPTAASPRPATSTPAVQMATSVPTPETPTPVLSPTSAPVLPTETLPQTPVVLSSPIVAPTAPSVAPRQVPQATPIPPPPAPPPPVIDESLSSVQVEISPIAQPTPTPSLRVRAFAGRIATLYEGCNDGRVIGAIGAVSPGGHHIEATVPAVPGDLLFLAESGCVRVYSAIVGSPDSGFSGFVNAEEVCIVRSSYEYWRNQASFMSAPGLNKLSPCTD